VQKETITLQKVLETIDSGDSFSIAFVTTDLKRNTGGEFISIERCRKHDFLTREEKAKIAKASPQTNMLHRNPHHYENSTRNIVMPNGEIRKCHIRLIRKFNGKTVL
jgi:hypothetical protein